MSKLFHFIAFILISPFIFSTYSSAQPLSPPCEKVGKVTINSSNIFDGDGVSILQASFNFMHYVTTERTIKRELLFKEGDCFNSELVEESERILRGFDILADVTFDLTHLTDDKHSGRKVDIHITTRDRFTMRAEISASRTGGENKSRVSLGEKNLFGLNKEIHYSRSSYSDGKELSRYVYQDNRFFKEYIIDSSITNDGTGVLEKYRLLRPFRSLNDKKSFGISYSRDNTAASYSLDGGEEVLVPRLSTFDAINYDIEFGTRKLSRRISLQLSQGSDTYFLTDPIPGEDQLREDQFAEDPPWLQYVQPLDKVNVDVKYSWNHRRNFIVLSGIDSLQGKEDVELRTSYSASVGGQVRETEELQQNHLKLSWSTYKACYVENYLLMTYQVKSSYRLYAGSLMAANTQAFMRAYSLISDRRSIAFGVTFDHERINDEMIFPLTLGGEYGLRGFDNGAFSGNKRLIGNLEFRGRLPSLSKEMFFGYTLFADAGYVWKNNESLSLRDLEANVGFGFRIQIPSLFGNDVLRLDIATPVDFGRMSLSITVGQVFNHNESDADSSAN